MNDTIYRQAAIDALQKEINKGIPPFDDVMGSIRCGIRLARNIIEDLPSAQPKRKTGRWVSVGCVVPGIANVPMIKCSVCGHLEPDVDAARTPYCSHCGSFNGGGGLNND